MAAPAKTTEGYAAHKDRAAELQRRKAAAGREIGGVPDIANVRRRTRCRDSLRLFCTTYNPEGFGMAWCADHLKVIARIEEAVTVGALFAFAMPRGTGKSSICRMGALWAMAYAHCRYVFGIGANAEKAEDMLAAVKTYCRFLPKFAEDFPEIAWPVACLAGIANRASGQTCGGEATLIEWGKDRVVLPTVPPPGNWPKAWPLRGDGMAPTSGAVFSASGLTGDGIRGSLLTLSTGESVRPDLVLLDDPQSSDSAHSPSQNARREQLVSADVLGMAGPGKRISAVMPCTVIARGDMVDKLLDRAVHPLWRGERTRMMRAMPTDLTAWDAYFEVYRHCAQKEPPDFRAANALYRADRNRLDAGAEASWPERKLAGEVSAVQHAMHLYCRDPRAFMSEYQNDPVESEGAKLADLVPADVAAKLTRVPRLVVPRECSRVTCGIDVGESILWYCVCAWDERFGGSVIDYGTWPRQNRAYFAKASPRPSIQSEFPGIADAAAQYKALAALTADVLGREYAQAETDAPTRVSRCLIDSGAFTETVYQFCRQTPFAAQVLPSKGYGVAAAGRPMSDWPRRPGERVGSDWRVGSPKGASGRLLTFDPNPWKTFAAERLQTPFGAPGCLAVFGADSHAHQLFADHMAGEYRTETTGHGRTVWAWQQRPGRPDNDYFDALVMATVAASEQGVKWSASGEAPAPRAAAGPRMKLSEIQAAKRNNGGR